MCWSSAGGTGRAGKGELWSAMVFCLLGTKGERGGEWVKQIPLSDPLPLALGTQCLCTHALFVPVSAAPAAPVPAPPLPLILPLKPAPAHTFTQQSPLFSFWAPKANRSLPSKVLPPLGLPCFPCAHLSAPSSPKLAPCLSAATTPYWVSAASSWPAGFILQKYPLCCSSLWLLLPLTGGAASSKGEGRMGALPFSCVPSSQGNNKPHLFTAQLSPHGCAVFRKELCVSSFFKVQNHWSRWMDMNSTCLAEFPAQPLSV